jgi:cold shock CspA family protein
MSETWNKRERERRKQQERQQKIERRQERKHQSKDGQRLEDMLAYVDENGNLTSQPPDPKKKISIDAADIDISMSGRSGADEEELLHTGIIAFFNNEKGYGFIRDQKSKESIFVHATSLQEAVKENNKVSFQVEKGPKGLNAIHVKVIRS